MSQLNFLQDVRSNLQPALNAAGAMDLHFRPNGAASVRLVVKHQHVYENITHIYPIKATHRRR
jgi:hypothetical protein